MVKLRASLATFFLASAAIIFLLPKRDWHPAVPLWFGGVLIGIWMQKEAGKSEE